MKHDPSATSATGLAADVLGNSREEVIVFGACACGISPRAESAGFDHGHLAQFPARLDLIQSAWAARNDSGVQGARRTANR